MKKYTVTIGIPAHNEEANIAYLLESVLCQKGDFTIEKILVFADGCTDATEEKVKAISARHPVVHLIADGERKGKASRLNQLHRENRSDIVINFDADIILEEANVIQKMLKYFNNKDVVAVSANNQPFTGETFIEKVTNASDNMWYEIRKDFEGGDNIYNCSGCAIAIKREFSSKLVLNEKTIADQQTVYISLWRIGKKMAYARNAIVRYRTPATLRDFFNQAGRSLVEKYYLPEYEDKSVRNLYHLPLQNKVLGVMRSLIANPFYTICAIILQILLRFQLVRRYALKQEAKWSMVKSTKAVIRS